MEKLNGCIADISNLAETDKLMMWRLMDKFYENVAWSNFLRDLSEKDRVILLRDNATGDIKGFSTIMLLQATVENIPVIAVFSGDTIIDKKYWGEQKLVQLLGRFFFSVIDDYPDHYACWFLISKGYKTYRFLPLYFREFYPCLERETPAFERSVIDALAFFKYGEAYDRRRGIIAPAESADFLKQGVADISEARLTSPHVRFFLEKNPGYARGEEIACIARLSRQNFQKIFCRIVASYKEESVGA